MLVVDVQAMQRGERFAVASRVRLYHVNNGRDDIGTRKLYISAVSGVL